MTYIKINFGGSFEDEFQKAVDEVFHLVRPAFKNYKCNWQPNVDVYESVDEVIVLADMAGINKEDLNIEVDRKRIKIAGILVVRMNKLSAGKVHRVSVIATK